MGVMSELLSRELITVRPEWESPQITESLRAALAGTGPALAFAATSRSHVSPEIAIVIPTSGSTGTPKEVAYTADAIRASARASHSYLGAETGDRWSLLLPINHIAGVNVLVRSLELGSDVIDNRLSGKSQTFESAEFTSIVPTQLHRALNGDQELLRHLQSAKKVLVGGAASNAALLRAAQQMDVDVITTYGMSEMSGGCVYDNSPLPGVNVEINNEGFIRLRGPMMAAGYLNEPDVWMAATGDGWFTTQDFGTLSAGLLTVSGRADDVIISGGENISLSTIDALLNNHFAPQRFIAFGLPDQEWGTKLCLASDSEMNRDAISDVLRSEFGKFAVPKEFQRVDVLPMRGIGKPDRAALVATFTR